MPEGSRVTDAPDLETILGRVAGASGPLVVLTGAGISAESGIPTFRGPEGYWRVGSRNYRPMELATQAAFRAVPDDVWGWYLYRRAVCRAARPNAAHLALVELDRSLSDVFLVTQNVDGLHLRAGHSPERTFQIHGNIDFMRCAAECCRDVIPIPAAIGDSWEKGRLPGERERGLLRCARCGAATRPHVLWFDECYDEERYRYESALAAAREADLLLVAGTSGATTLPVRAGELAARSGAAIVDVNPEPNPFRDLALSVPRGAAASGRSAEILPEIVDRLLAVR
ncbi:MAG: RNA polymerase subunit sigma [Planctomycetes bacterium]|nr:RNA polymerase subunit sigma [Planctomycetota bacterium]